MVGHYWGEKKKKEIEIEELAPKTVNSISRFSKRLQSFQGNSIPISITPGKLLEEGFLVDHPDMDIARS